MNDRNEIIRALRCISTQGGHCIGEKCPYHHRDEIELGGKTEQYDGCDVDRIGMEAAKLLEFDGMVMGNASDRD